MGNRQVATQFYNQAATAANDKSNATNITTAWQLFASACYMDPTFGQAFFQYGNNCFDQQKHHAAIASYRRALSCEMTKPERAKTLCNLGWNLFTVGKVREAHAALLESTDTDPSYAAAWINLSNTCGVLDMPMEALHCAEQGYKLEPFDPQNEAVLAFALLFDRQFAAGLKHFECRFKWKLHSFLQYPYPRWVGEPDKTLFLVADQGLGDTLSYSRFVHAAAKRCKYIHAYVQPELLRLFTHAFIGLDNINLLPFGATFPAADYWTTFVSLPFALGLTDDEIREAPPIETPRYSLPTSWMVPDQKLHIGIAWKGSTLNNINQHRSIPIQHFLELYRIPGVQLYSLQVGEFHDEVNSEGTSGLIRDLTPYIRDVVDTISLLHDLDLVITCESALGHICSLIGKDCIIPYSYLGRDYRIGHSGSDRLWTPHHTVIRQDIDQRWEPVFENIIDRVRERINDRRGIFRDVSRSAEPHPQARHGDAKGSAAVSTLSRRERTGV